MLIFGNCIFKWINNFKWWKVSFFKYSFVEEWKYMRIIEDWFFVGFLEIVIGKYRKVRMI